MGTYKYKAFISYSHKDDRWGRWLHRRLENYPLPKNIVGNITRTGEIPKRLKPIFRDREELAAADNLGDKIEQALSNSENLIMICSPAAARSHWVNQEVLYFKRHNRGAQIFSVIVEGEPFASTMPGREDEECFPPALRYQLDETGELSDIPAEPLAADMRDHADGKRLGVLKLVSGMIGVGLDEVVQRDMRRGRKRVTAITTGALATVLAMGTLTGFALDARAEAEQRRVAAEGQIEFMLTELRSEVQKVGRLDALNVVAQQTEAYYKEYPPKINEYDARARQARVFQYIGEIQVSLGNLDEASKYFDRAFAATKDLLEHDLNNPDRIFDHAQSEFYVGQMFWDIEQYEKARPYFDAYINHAETLKKIEPNSVRSQQEVTYAYTNLGILLFRQGEVGEAYSLYLNALPAYERIANSIAASEQSWLDLADAYAWLADAAQFVEGLNVSEEYREKSNRIYEDLLKSDPDDFEILPKYVGSLVALSRIKIMQGRLDEAIAISDIGHQKAQKHYSHDKSNTDWALSLMSLNLQKVEIFLLENRLREAELYLSEAEKIDQSLQSLQGASSSSLRATRLSQKFLKICSLIANDQHDQAIRLLEIEDAFEVESTMLGSNLANPYISYSLLKRLMLKQHDELPLLVTDNKFSPQLIHPKFISNIQSFCNLLNVSDEVWGQFKNSILENRYHKNDLFKITIEKFYSQHIADNN